MYQATQGQDMNTPNQPHYLTVVEVAEHLKLHPKTVRRLIRDGYLPAIRVSRRGDFRISRDDLEKYKQERQA